MLHSERMHSFWAGICRILRIFFVELFCNISIKYSCVKVLGWNFNFKNVQRLLFLPKTKIIKALLSVLWKILAKTGQLLEMIGLISRYFTMRGNTNTLNYPLFNKKYPKRELCPKRVHLPYMYRFNKNRFIYRRCTIL